MSYPHSKNPNPEPLAQVPDEVSLPTWLNVGALAHPDALPDLLAESRGIEAGLIAIAEQLGEHLRRLRALELAAYMAANPYCRDNEAPDLPEAVVEAVRVATGVAHVRDLVVWLTCTDGDMVVGDGERDRMYQRFGYLDGWDELVCQAAYRLVGIDPEAE